MIRFKAFAKMTTIRSTGDSSGAMITAEYKLVASDGSPTSNSPSGNTAVVTFGYDSNTEGVRQALADAIRDDAGNQDITVTFVDGH